ncbi:MAG: protein kinase [Planctomycetes bacterium]|nr:protein kinase [Planctomycetota bacterium]
MAQTCTRCGTMTEWPASTAAEEKVCPACRGQMPASVGKYRIEGFLGAGGMGQVFKGTHPDLKRTVAIKVLRTIDGAGNAARRFVREAQLSAKLVHPNIVQVYDAGEEQDRHYIVMEYVPGRSLKEAMAKGPMAPREALRIALIVARALQFAHEQGVVHRDVKPSNILLDAKGTPRLLDFGLAKSVEERGFTASGEMLGTPSYMSPEQARGEIDRLDGRSDVYSLGAVLYEMLAGRPPHRAPSVLGLLHLIQTKAPEPPSALRAGLPKALDDLCLRALARAPEKRFRSAAELADAIKAAGGGKSASRPFPVLPVAIGSGLLVVALVLAAAYWPRKSAPPPALAASNVPAKKPSGDDPRKRQPEDDLPKRQPQDDPAKKPQDDSSRKQPEDDPSKKPEADRFWGLLRTTACAESLLRLAVPGVFWMYGEAGEEEAALRREGAPEWMVWLASALKELDSGRYAEGLEAVRKARAVGAESEPALYVEGAILLAQGKRTRQWENFNAWAKALPASTTTRVRVIHAIGLGAQDRGAEALAAAQRLRKDAPTEPEPVVASAILRQMECDFDAARALALDVEKLSPESFDPLPYRTFLLLIGALFDPVKNRLHVSDLGDLSRVLDARLASADLHCLRFARGFVHAVLGHWKDAEEDLAAARKGLDPDQMEDHRQLRDVALLAGRPRLDLILGSLEIQKHLRLDACVKDTCTELLAARLDGREDAREIRRDAHRTLAILAARARDEKEVFRHLEEALKLGYPPADAEKEEDFAAWKENAKFRELLRKYR